LRNEHVNTGYDGGRLDPGPSAVIKSVFTAKKDWDSGQIVRGMERGGEWVGLRIGAARVAESPAMLGT
jgi:hypothetical protein